MKKATAKAIGTTMKKAYNAELLPDLVKASALYEHGIIRTSLTIA